MTILDKILFHYHKLKLNLIKILIFNFKTLPLSLTFKFPGFFMWKSKAFICWNCSILTYKIIIE